MPQNTFGRRHHPPQLQPQRVRKIRSPAATSAGATAPAAAEQSWSLPAPAASAAIDQELADWKRARRRNYRLPWRQLSFLATIFFGLASLALPDQVNDNVQWALYGLMAASLYAGFAARRRKANL